MMQLKFVFRKLWRDSFFTFLKVIGLAIGIAVCLVIFKIVFYEFSFDKKHPEKEKIYQVVNWSMDGEEKDSFGGVQPVLASFIKETFPELENIVPLNKQSFSYVSVERADADLYREEDPSHIKSTTSSYFDMVVYDWLAGDKATALLEPNQVVLTQSRAKKYFGEMPASQVVGNTIGYEGKPYLITGVIADLDFPSSFEGKEFVSRSQEENLDTNWYTFNSRYTLFVKLEDNQKERLVQTLDAKYDEVIPEAWRGNWWTPTKYELLSLSEKHFAHEYATEEYASNKNIVLGLVGIGSFILLLACINYVNLSTAQIPYQTKEIGIRKTLGEKNTHLTSGFLLETSILCLFATALALPMAKGFEVFYADFMPPRIGDYSNVLITSAFIVGLLLVLTFITSLYPAFLIHKVNVSEALKTQGIARLSYGNLNIRKTAIVLQFVIAQVFVMATFIISSQIHFMISSELGFDKDAVIVIDIPYKSYHGSEKDPFLFKQALKKYPEIQQVALGHIPMSEMYWGNNLYAKPDTTEIELNMNFKYVDTDYLDLYGIKLLAGRKPEPRDTVGSVFINQAARIGLGFHTNEEAVDQMLRGTSNNYFQVVGVLDDFHQTGLYSAKEALTVVMSNRKDRLSEFSVKLPNLMTQWPKAIENIEKEWNIQYPNAPFVFDFYDTKIKQMYESDLRQSKIINLAMSITIVLSCLGLLGLVTLTAYQRTKEIGIRKVLGASVIGVVGLLAKDYLKLIGLAILISIPIAWWMMNRWLEDFAYRIEIKWWMFLITGLATIFIALLAVSYRAIKAAIANPIKSLRTE